MVLPYSLYAGSAPGNGESPMGDVSWSVGEHGERRYQSGQAMMPQICPNCVSNVYFSEENVAALQEGIRYGVYKQSNGEFVIGKQSRDELMLVMRSIYLEYSLNLDYNILEQVRSLNKRVLDYCIPQVTREVQMYRTYVRDSTTQPIPMSHAAYTNRNGLRGAQDNSRVFRV